MNKTRLFFLDAVRGFNLFWILGADGLFAGFREVSGSGLAQFVAAQLDHPAWDGFTFYDTIFPLFIFLAGVSLSLSFPAAVAKKGREAAFLGLLRRCLILFALGIFVNGGLSDPFNEIRYVGVLQRIALCSLAAGGLSLFMGRKGLLLAAAGALLGYWALLSWVPYPGGSAGDMAQGANIVDWLDMKWVPGSLYLGNHDPEGLLSTLPALANCLAGMAAGSFLWGKETGKAFKLAAAGLAAVLIGWAWSFAFPLNKNLWTSSYALLCIGLSCLLLAFFYHACEIRKQRAWALPFAWLGANSIALYLVGSVVHLHGISQRLVGGDVALLLQPWHKLAASLASLGLVFLLARFLYRRGIFIKI